MTTSPQTSSPPTGGFAIHPHSNSTTTEKVQLSFSERLTNTLHNSASKLTNVLKGTANDDGGAAGGGAGGAGSATANAGAPRAGAPPTTDGLARGGGNISGTEVSRSDISGNSLSVLSGQTANSTANSTWGGA